MMAHTDSVTPLRPARSIHRHTLHSSASTHDPTPITTSDSSQNTAVEAALSPSSSTDDSHEPRSPTTQPPLAQRKSTISVGRKPVPTNVEIPSLDVKVDDLGSAHTSIEPPRYVLPVDLPIPSSRPSTSSLPPAYIHAEASSSTVVLQHHRVDTVVHQHPHSGAPSFEFLPTYAEETTTEPKTLARSLWRWGWFCPLLWGIGMFILWIPLRPIEEEHDLEKAQTLEEMIVILREAELKYAKRCLYGFASFTTLLIVIIVTTVIVSIKT